MMSGLTRREFMKRAAGACAATFIPSITSGADEGVPTRLLGNTGEKVSILGLGGNDAASIDDDKECIDFIRKAIDMGINFMDNAWEYRGGRAEEIMGKALRDGYRKKVFLMTKHHGRDKKTALQHLDDSLRKLQTDVIDLWQFHELVYPKDPEMIFTMGGIEAAEEAKKAGKVRFIGFTGHKDPAIFKDMLDRDYDWDAAQMPINVFDAHFKSFVNEIVPILKERKIGVIGMKSLCCRLLMQANVCSVSEGINYALSQPVDTLVSGMRNNEQLEMNVGLARSFKPMDDAELEKLLVRTKEAALTGEYEPFKTTRRFDGRMGKKLHGIPFEERRR
ncbi:MAG: aldo/keto reductase [Planctomycetota bacterium]|jgi:predicted aldo/keto reductase-like oxidoreductase